MSKLKLSYIYQSIRYHLRPQKKLKQDRKQILLSQIDKNHLGLEIGPSHSPIAPRRDGFNVRILDYLNKPDLQKKYDSEGVDSSRIEDVDFVWQGQPYIDLVGEGTQFSWIISSHNIEHMPNLIGFLLNCMSILQPGGILSLAIPDHRYVFDTARTPSPLSSIIDAHLRGDTFPSPGSIAEFFLRASSRSGLHSWTRDSPAITSAAKRINPPNYAKERLDEFLKTKTDIDVHVWCFTPESFISIIEDLISLGFLTDIEIASQPQSIDGWEFFVCLRKKG